MRKILVANPKGGCGKSTIAVHLASWFAMNDEVVYLGDLDRQQSSRLWLEMRSAEQVAIRHWDPTEDLVAPPRDCSVAIYDTPAGLHGKRLKQLLGEVERVIVPVSPSRFDMLASRDFFDELAEAKAIRKERVGVGIIGMRVDARANSTRELVEFLEQFELPLLTCLRSTQRYVRALESGVTLFESHEAAAAIDRLQWQPLLEWLVTRRSA
ncbi:MAG: ParA family protein [Rhodocyclaceae bacterium]|nr:ParA family protein [Rhodocyclaceae bacterium]MCP5232339.1 ParA family protein [Zoogloeaceae bacterium]MCP5241149.1 ParA family protein [Zoogloeaceae bacterium]MCP5254953.1 ParA family protein [Zoogloeaceae bacterium]MCP5295409.1 ParA family protein [Zoogloeaceae bacterium]